MNTDAAVTPPPFGPGELEKWFGTFSSFSGRKGHHAALSLFEARFGGRGFPKFEDAEWLGLVIARQAGIAASTELAAIAAPSRPERRRLTAQIREGELAAELIAAGVVCLIVKHARQYAEQVYRTAYSQHLDDLIQVGLERLEDTVQKFDTTSDRTFILYFVKALMASLRSYVDKNTTDIGSLPASSSRIRRIAMTGKSKLETELGRPPTMDELQAECLKYCTERTMEREVEKDPSRSTAELEAVVDAQLRKQGTLGAIERLPSILNSFGMAARLDETVGDGGTSRGDLIADSADVTGAAVEQNDMIESVREALETLEPRQQFVLSARFGFIDGEEWTFADIAEKLEVSAERVRQICNAGLKKLSLPGATATVLAGHLDFDA